MQRNEFLFKSLHNIQIYIIFSENKLFVSKELEELIEMYKLERNLQREDSDISIGSDVGLKVSMQQINNLSNYLKPSSSSISRALDCKSGDPGSIPRPCRSLSL
jgi:hypothetical protein